MDTSVYISRALVIVPIRLDGDIILHRLITEVLIYPSEYFVATMLFCD
jgi:hypothetical protein